jgi:hypothetical protein
MDLNKVKKVMNELLVKMKQENLHVAFESFGGRLVSSFYEGNSAKEDHSNVWFYFYANKDNTEKEHLMNLAFRHEVINTEKIKELFDKLVETLNENDLSCFLEITVYNQPKIEELFPFMKTKFKYFPVGEKAETIRSFFEPWVLDYYNDYTSIFEFQRMPRIHASIDIKDEPKINFHYFDKREQAFHIVKTKKEFIEAIENFLELSNDILKKEEEVLHFIKKTEPTTIIDKNHVTLSKKHFEFYIYKSYEFGGKEYFVSNTIKGTRRNKDLKKLVDKIKKETYDYFKSV